MINFYNYLPTTYIMKFFKILFKKHFTEEQKQKNDVKKITEMLNVISKNIEEFLVNNLKGTKDDTLPFYKKVFAARYVFQDIDFKSFDPTLDLEAEILAALAQELRTEIMFNLLMLMNQSGAVGATLPDTLFNFSVLPGIFDQAKKDGFVWAIISPTAFTIIQSASYNDDLIRHNNENDTNYPLGGNFPDFVGTYKGIKLYINAYGNVSQPIILGKENSFKYSGEKFEISEQISENGENVAKFFSDFTFVIDNSKISLINIDPKNLSFI